jgi:hypothetical protein
MLGRYKCNGLFGLYVNDEEKGFITLTLVVSVIETVFFVADDEAK